VGLDLRFLPGLPSARTYPRLGADVRPGARRFRGSVEGVPIEPFREWREEQAFTACRMWDTEHRLPTQSTDGRSTCFCGAGLMIASVTDHIRSAHMEAASCGFATRHCHFLCEKPKETAPALAVLKPFQEDVPVVRRHGLITGRAGNRSCSPSVCRGA
jgi:hypothetical protein